MFLLCNLLSVSWHATYSFLMVISDRVTPLDSRGSGYCFAADTKQADGVPMGISLSF